MPHKRISAACLLGSALLLAASAGARAQVLVSAKVLSSEGRVEIERRAQGESAFAKISLRASDQLLAGDVIKTYKGGRLVVGLSDGSQAIIGENTTVEIGDLARTPRTIFNVLRGKTRVKIEKLGGRPNPYRVNTPTAVIAVRGTLFDVLAKDAETQVFVHEGEVAVTNATMPDAPVILSPGQRTRVEPSQPPAPPSAFPTGRNDDAFKSRARDDDRQAHDGGRGGDSRDGHDADARAPSQPGDRRGHGGQPPNNQPPASPPPGGRPPAEDKPDEDAPAKFNS